MAAPHLDKPESPRAGFRVIRDEDAPAYDGQAQPKQGYTRVPELVRAMNDGFALAVFEAIARNDNGSHESWPSVATICERTGWSRKVVEPAIKRLIAVGALVKESRKLNGMDQANLYRITAWNQVVPTELPVVPTAPLGSSHGTYGSFPQNYKQEPVEQKPIEQEPTGTPPSPPVRSDPKPKRQPKTVEPSQAFLTRFWNRYPKNGRGNRGESFELWEAMTPEEQDAAVDALALFARCSDWQRGYSPGAQVWLRNRRWIDPPDDQPQAMAVAPVVPYRSEDGLTVITGSKLDGVFNELRRERAEREGRVTADGAVIEARWTEGNR